MLKFGSTSPSAGGKFDGAAIYRRSTGLIVDSLRMSSRLGSPIQLNWRRRVSARPAGDGDRQLDLHRDHRASRSRQQALGQRRLQHHHPEGAVIDINFANNSQDLYGFGTNDPDDTQSRRAVILQLDCCASPRWRPVRQLRRWRRWHRSISPGTPTTRSTSSASGLLPATTGHRRSRLDGAAHREHPVGRSIRRPAAFSPPSP